jgi:endonuclease YncB( thermonuclease family)
MDSLTPYTYYGSVIKVQDGDSFKVNIDLGLETWHHNLNVRLNGCNAFELKQPGGKEARQHLVDLLASSANTVLLQSVQYDKFGSRIDADVFLIDHAGKPLPNGNVTQLMIAAGFAAAWNGQGEKPVPVWPIPNKK